MAKKLIGIQKRILIAAILFPLLLGAGMALQILLDRGIDWIFADWIVSFAAPPLNLVAIILAIAVLIKQPMAAWALAVAASVLNILSAWWWVSLNRFIRIGSGV